jgi:hypothetical protein
MPIRSCNAWYEPVISSALGPSLLSIASLSCSSVVGRLLPCGSRPDPMAEAF